MWDAERRNEERYKLSMEVFIIVTEHPEDSKKATATEISCNGLRVRVSQPINPDTSVAIFFHLDALIMIRGWVVWSQSIQMEDDTVYEHGIRTDTVFFQYKQTTGFIETPDVFGEILNQLRHHGGKLVSQPNPVGRYLT